MGCCLSTIERQEMVSRCRARKKYIKHLLHSRNGLSVSHSFYLRSLRATGATLLSFSTAESSLLLHPRPLTNLPPPTPPHSLPPTPPPGTDTCTWTTTTSSTTNATILPPPPPPVAEGGSTWDFWDPWRSGAEEWESGDGGGGNVTAGVRVEGSSTVSKESEMAVVVVGRGKELVEIIKELDEYFLRAADAGSFVSGVLQVPSFATHNSFSGKGYNYGRSLNWSPLLNGKLSGLGFAKLGDDCGGGGGGGHCATLERLYAWEKKLFHEVKNAEKLKIEHEKRIEQLRRLEVKRGDYMKTEKSKKDVEKLESLLEVATKAIHTTSEEIIKLRETELYPQLLDLIKGFMSMWRSMYECHQVQTHIVDQLKYLNAIPSNEPTSEIHRQSTLQLEAELQQWQQSFNNLVKSQRDYIHSLTGWLRLSLFQFNKNPLMRSIQDSTIYSLCEEWQLQIDRIPDKVASEGINSLLSVIHAIVIQQAEEHKQKKRSESANKELEKKAAELRSAESKYGPYSLTEMISNRKGRDPVGEKRAKVDLLKVKAEEEKARHEKAVGVTRAMTLNNMQMALPRVFQAITGFASVCTENFEQVFNKAKGMDQGHDVKRLMA